MNLARHARRGAATASNPLRPDRQVSWIQPEASLLRNGAPAMRQ
jgi:hypothetical protein